MTNSPVRILSILLLLSISLISCEDSTDRMQASTPSEIEDRMLEDAGEPPRAVASAGYVGAQQCASCHSLEFDAWQRSHHDLAMQVASTESVLGNFDNAVFDYFDTESVFYREADDFYVRTDGSDGTLEDFKIAYTFGVTPLQQYLIEFPDGSLQALSIVWDSRPESEGGQRWYHLYPDEYISAGDELHWTGVNQNWNFMCADCHSTDLQKNYNSDTNSYATTWSEIDVGCEACHGPGENHVALASASQLTDTNTGFQVAFNENVGASWLIDSSSGNAVREPEKTTNTEIETCAQCHSRRSTAHPGARPGSNFLDHFNLSLLTEALYHSDGQIDGEVYVYGSFLQSKMYNAGVTCSNCHEPHSVQLRVEGNGLCAQCHSAEMYDSPNHHFHEEQSAAAECVSCHMPDKIYMGVDARRDHSFRIPRPNLSVDLGTPNACNSCHEDETPQWAASILRDRGVVATRDHYAYAIHAGRIGAIGAPQLLSELVLDATQPAIVRGTATALLPQYFSQQTASILQLAAQDSEPLLGLGLAGVLQSLPEQYRAAFAVPLLYDASRVTRGLAAGSLAGVSLQNLPPNITDKFNEEVRAYIASEEFNSDRPESMVNLAAYYSAVGDGRNAERYFSNAIDLEPWYVPAYINLADHYRRTGNDGAALEVLESGFESVRQPATLQHSAGLTLVRMGRTEEALDYLRLAAESSDTTDRYQYVYAIGLNSVGRWEQAIAVLEQAQELFPNNRDILAALVSINRENGRSEEADFYESQLF